MVGNYHRFGRGRDEIESSVAGEITMKSGAAAFFTIICVYAHIVIARRTTVETGEFINKTTNQG
jgi:hypothetical protein